MRLKDVYLGSRWGEVGDGVECISVVNSEVVE